LAVDPSPSGEWCVVTLWATESDADSAISAGGTHGAVAHFDSLVDPTTLSRSRYVAIG